MTVKPHGISAKVERFSSWATSASGSTPGFSLATLMILAWLIAGPAFHYSKVLHDHYRRLAEVAKEDDNLTKSHSIEEAKTRQSTKLDSRKTSVSGPTRAAG